MQFASYHHHVIYSHTLVILSFEADPVFKFSSVADPDPSDQYVFGPPGSGSGSSSQMYGSGSINQRHGSADPIRIHIKMSWIRNTEIQIKWGGEDISQIKKMYDTLIV
jgi:hypothetical protein